jgi:hypothetical protein
MRLNQFVGIIFGNIQLSANTGATDKIFVAMVGNWAASMSLGRALNGIQRKKSQ